MRAMARNDKIDFMRGVAILAVLLLHFNLSYPLDKSAIKQVFSINFINAVVNNGNYGVTIFFVISGFLITSTSLNRYHSLGKIDLIDFYIRRFSRIMPCLLLVLTLIVLFSTLHIPIFQNDLNSTSLALAVFSVLTFWHNYLMEKIGYFNYCLNIFWSLSVEEVFYLAFPLLCLALKKTRYILPCLMALIICAPIVRSHYTDNDIVALYGYFSCFDAIAIGCIAAILSRKIIFPQNISHALLYTAGIFIAGVYLYSDIMDNVVVGVSLIAAGTAVYLICAVNESTKAIAPANLPIRVISWFGRNSYELYLFHIVILALMKEMVRPDSLNDYTKLIWMIVFFASSAFVAGMISAYYSQPMNIKWREFLFHYRNAKIMTGESLHAKFLSPSYADETAAEINN